INVDRRHERDISLALESDPELAVYHLTVDANRDKLKLKGKLPNQYLRSKAEQIAKGVVPKLKINNGIIAIEIPPDPVLTAAEVKRVTALLNQMAGAIIAAEYREGKVTVRGTVIQQEDAEKVTQAFLQVPGVKSVSNTVQLQPQAIASRVYFERGSAVLKAEEQSKILAIREFLKQFPTKNLRLIGHTDPVGTTAENQPLALERAKAVRDALVNQGVEAKRLEVIGTTEAPLGVDDAQLPLLSRCVEFELTEP
ncbi:MAG TPA: OmpA family protein, partial [Cyanophyceae cyanobacterium]